MKYICLFIAGSIWLGTAAHAQSTISLNSLYESLQSNHPYKKLSSLQEDIRTQQLALNRTSVLPQSNLSGQGSWQSAVTKVPIAVPGIDIPEPSKDQYRIVLDLNQSLYDGGTKKSIDRHIDQQNEVEKANAEVLVYNLKESLCRAFFAAKSADLSMGQLDLLIKDLEEKQTLLAAQINEGIVSGYQSSGLKVKIMEAKQSKEEIINRKASAIQTINTLTGLNITGNAELNYDQSASTTTRPEYLVFDAQRKYWMSNHEVSKTKYTPKVQVFSQIGYGRPGLNFLTNEFKPYAIIGLRGQWNLSNLYLNQSGKENKILQSNLEKINVHQENFDLQQKIKADQQKKELEHYENLAGQDDEIIRMFETILKSSAVRLEQGISNINDYTTDANNLVQAKIKKDQHRILAQQAYELLNIIQSK